MAGVGIAIVADSWFARTAGALARGMTQVDTQWHHLRIAATFVQSGRTPGISILDGDSVTAYFPATSSLLHAVGILFFHTDIVSTVVNLGWFTVALLAAWSLGKRFGTAATTAAAAVLVLGTPVLVETQPGGALTAGQTSAYVSLVPPASPHGWPSCSPLNICTGECSSGRIFATGSPP